MLHNLSKSSFFIPPSYCQKTENEPTNSQNENSFLQETALSKIKVSNPGDILQLLENLSDKCTKRLEVKLNRYLKNLCSAELVFIINLHSLSKKAVIQVIQEEILQQNYYADLSDESMNSIIYFQTHITNCLEKLDVKLKNLINQIVHVKNVQFTLVPVLSNESEGKYGLLPVYLICVTNSTQDSSWVSNIVSETFRYCSTLFLNTRRCEEERMMKLKCQNIILVERELLSHIDNSTKLLKVIMSTAMNLLKAERSCLFVLDPYHMHLIARDFDGAIQAENGIEIKVAGDQKLAGHVAVTGQLLNVKNPQKHPLFKNERNRKSNLQIRNILCFPLKADGRVIAVAELFNKIGGEFDFFDEEVANGLSTYCGMATEHSFIHRKIQDFHIRANLCGELLLRHIPLSQQDVIDVLMCSENQQDIPNFSMFSFTPRKILPKETPCLVLKMMRKLGFIDFFGIKIDILTRFVLCVKNGYSNAPYHNWCRAFSTVHFAYLTLRNFKLVEKNYFTMLEALAYFISCLCHDIDHLGVVNSSWQQSNRVLASIYSSEGSVMERHHLSQTFYILNNERCNFLDSLSDEDYVQCIGMIKDMILATDLASHYKIHSKQLTMAQEGYSKTSPEHRYYLACLLMTCADLSEQTKDWVETKRAAQLIYAELFTTRGEDKIMRLPVSIEQSSIVDNQLDFLTQCCICIFKILATIFPQAKTLVDAIKLNILSWESSKSIYHQLCSKGLTPYEALLSDELDHEVQKTLENLKK